LLLHEALEALLEQGRKNAGLEGDEDVLAVADRGNDHAAVHLDHGENESDPGEDEGKPRIRQPESRVAASRNRAQKGVPRKTSFVPSGSERV